MTFQPKSLAQEAGDENLKKVPSIRKTNDPGRSESSSRQFIVYGDDWKERGNYCLLAEEVKKDFLNLLRLDDEWSTQVVIQLKDALGGVNNGKPVESRVQVIAGGFRFALRVELGDSLKMEDVREELLHLLMFEQILKQGRGVEGVRGTIVIPTWLRSGVAGAIAFRSEPTRRNSIYKAIFESGRMLPIEVILKGRPKDATSVVKALYDASAAGLITTLLDQRDGVLKLNQLMVDLLRFDGTDIALLKKHFPDLENSNNSLEKWWALQVATLATPTMLDILTVSESDASLQKALLVSFMEEKEVEDDVKKKRKPLFRLSKRGDGETGGEETQKEYVIYDLTEFDAFIKHKDIDKIVTSNEMNLSNLSDRAFPLYRSIIREYQAVFEQIKRGKRKGLAEKLEELTALRMEFVKMARDTEDYLHLYEANAPDYNSGAFDDYFKLFEKLKSSEPKKDDPISVYLDKLEKEWDR
jgi:hypothetical protein